MYISPYIVQSLHEDRIRDGQKTARSRVISDKQAVSLFSRISQLLRVRDTRETSDARHAHAI